MQIEIIQIGRYNSDNTPRKIQIGKDNSQIGKSEDYKIKTNKKGKNKQNDKYTKRLSQQTKQKAKISKETNDGKFKKSGAFNLILATPNEVLIRFGLLQECIFDGTQVGAHSALYHVDEMIQLSQYDFSGVGFERSDFDLAERGPVTCDNMGRAFVAFARWKVVFLAFARWKTRARGGGVVVSKPANMLMQHPYPTAPRPFVRRQAVAACAPI